MTNPLHGIGTKAGIAGGTLLSVLVNISSGDVLRTSVLAAIGALVSFTVSVLLKALFQRFKKKHHFRR